MTTSDGIEFSTVMSSAIHDIKNSLSLIITTIDSLSEDKQLSAHSRDSLELLHQEGKRLNNQLIQLLSLYRINNQQYHANIDNHNVLDCLEDIALENEQLLASNNLELTIACDESLNWCFDRSLMLGTLNTILNNACRHAKKRITLSADTDAAQLVITILDDGEGYPQTMLDNDATQHAQIDFYRGNTGLGLHFARVVAQLHHNNKQCGHIEISNDDINGGGKFTLHLP